MANRRCVLGLKDKTEYSRMGLVSVFRGRRIGGQREWGALGLVSKGCSSGAQLMHRPCPRVHRSSSCPLMHQQAPVPPSLESATCITFRNCTLLKHRLVLLLETVPCISFANSVCQTASFATFRNCILQYILNCTQ